MYDRAFIDYLIYFHCERDYFECHEVLEEHWKKDPPKERKKYLVGFIQIAVGLYHQRRGNFNGAFKMISNAIDLLEDDPISIEKLGLHSEKLLKLLKERKNEIKNKQSYRSINLPITDETLMSLCLQHCSDKNVIWGTESDLSNEHLIHKHSKRDRTEVIEERLLQLKKRKET
jgi:uncharacterized protein